MDLHGAGSGRIVSSFNPASPHYVFDRDDLHGIQVDTIYAGSLLRMDAHPNFLSFVSYPLAYGAILETNGRGSKN
jgi:hypothetical protein